MLAAAWEQVPCSAKLLQQRSCSGHAWRPRPQHHTHTHTHCCLPAPPPQRHPGPPLPAGRCRWELGGGVLLFLSGPGRVVPAVRAVQAQAMAGHAEPHTPAGQSLRRADEGYSWPSTAGTTKLLLAPAAPRAAPNSQDPPFHTQARKRPAPSSPRRQRVRSGACAGGGQGPAPRLDRLLLPMRTRRLPGGDQLPQGGEGGRGERWMFCRCECGSDASEDA
jgi:hypothetical protein